MLAGLIFPSGNLSLHFIPGLLNDSISQARRLEGNSGEIMDNNRYATTEPGESRSGLLSGQTLWYSYVAPADGLLELSTAPPIDASEPPYVGPLSKPALTVFQGDSLSSLQTIPATGELFQSQRVPVRQGKTYSIQLDNAVERRAFSCRILYSFHPAITNDAFADRSRLGQAPDIQFHASNWGASRETGEPRHGSLQVGASVWWTWTAPATGNVRLFSTDAITAPTLNAFVGDSVDSLTPVATYTRQDTNAWITFPVVAGQAYQLVFDYPYSSAEKRFYFADATLALQFTTLQITSPAPASSVLSDQPTTFRISTPAPAFDGNVRQVEYLLRTTNWFFPYPRLSLGVASNAPFSLRADTLPCGTFLVEAVVTAADGSTKTTSPVQFRVLPGNDNFARAQLITSRVAHFDGSSAGATLEPGEPVVNPGGDLGSVWYQWTAPASALVDLTFHYGYGFRVYRGTALANLQRVTDLSSGQLSFHAEAGVTYWITLAMPVNRTYFEDDLFLDFSARTVTLAQPTAGSTWPIGATVPLRAVTDELPAEITTVQFLVDSNVVSTATQPPYTATWGSPKPGAFIVQSRTRFANGEVATTPPAEIRVVPSNDAYVNAGLITGTAGVLRGTTHGATPDPDVPLVTDPYQTAWHRWVAPVSGRLVFSDAGTTGEVGVTFLEGDLPARQPESVRFTAALAFQASVWQGATYWFRFASRFEGVAGDYDCRFEILPGPPNDAFARRIGLTGSSPELSVNTLGASAEQNEPAHEPPAAGSSIWWTWTAPGDGIASFDVLAYAEGGFVQIAVYTGETLEALQRVPAFANAYGFSPFLAHGGQTYQIACDDLNASSHGGRFRLRFSPLPVNDAFAARQPLAEDSADVLAVNYGATLEPGEPDHHPGSPNGGSLWWRWRAPRTASIRLLASENPVGIAVYRGNVLDQLQPVANGYREVSFDAEAGVEYDIATDVANGVLERFRLQLAQFQPQPGSKDLFARRQRLSGDRFLFLDDNRGAGREFQEPLHGGQYGGHSLWYAWRATIDGEVTLDVQGTAFSFPKPLLGAYTGTALKGLTQVDGSSPAGELGSTLTFLAHAGEDYAIAVDGKLGQTGVFQFSLRQVAGAPPASLELLPQSAGNLSLHVSGLAGRPAVFEYSQDLINWAQVEEILAGQDDRSYVVPLTQPQGSAFFYRVRMP